MILRFFADQCVPSHIIKTLQDAGFQVLRLRDHIAPDSPDHVVISEAQRLGAILVTLNGDFADIVTYPPERYKGIIALQVRNHPEIVPQIAERLKDYVSKHNSMSDFAGILFLVEPHRIRIRS
jgi:predicted nuclease of predicted toxin-antitoxin system